MPKSLTKIIFKNSIFSVASYFVQLIIVFIITPYMLHKLGTTLFGIWALISVVTSYTQLADFGIGRSIIKFVAEYEGKKDGFGLSEIINTSFILYIIIGSVSFIIFLFLDRFFVVKVLNIPDESLELTLFVYYWTITIFFMNLVLGIFRSAINGLQRMDITQSILTVSSIIRAVGTFIVLEAGFGLKGLIVKNGVISFLAIVANYAFFKKLLPRISIRWKYFNIKRIKEIVKFSLNVELSYLLSTDFRASFNRHIDIRFSA